MLGAHNTQIIESEEDEDVLLDTDEELLEIEEEIEPEPSMSNGEPMGISEAVMSSPEPSEEQAEQLLEEMLEQESEELEEESTPELLEEEAEQLLEEVLEEETIELERKSPLLEEDAEQLIEETLENEINQAIPSFLEPSPILIEPEYEPEEVGIASSESKEAPSGSSSSSSPKEAKYDIELLDVGPNKEHIIHILSKINGLTNPPQDLVGTVPCIIARGANESDAKNFQVLMKKFGSNIRLIQK
jgi:hypothetical protein